DEARVPGAEGRAHLDRQLADARVVRRPRLRRPRPPRPVPPPAHVRDRSIGSPRVDLRARPRDGRVSAGDRPHLRAPRARHERLDPEASRRESRHRSRLRRTFGAVTPMDDRYGFDPYAVLGLERTAGDVDIRARYRELIRAWHPDLSDHPEAHERAAEI